jgi:predicted Zn-dependent peptidase
MSALNPDIRVTTLDSGLTVISDRMTTVETVSLGAWVATGTRFEPPAVNGVAHLLEHMAFKGTGRRSAQQIAEEMDAVGGILNAYTSREQTAYYAKVLRQDVDLALDIVADILQHSVLDEDELKRERQVVIQEIYQANDTPDDIVFDHFQAAAFPGAPLGLPVLGTVDIVSRLDRPTLQGWLDRHYGGPRMVLSAAGNIEHDRLVDAAARLFTALPADRAGGPAPRPAAAIDGGGYAGGEYREKRDLEQLHLIVGFPGLSHHAEDYWAQAVFSTLLGGGMSSRLFQEIREKRGLVYTIQSFASAYADGGLFGVYAGTGGSEAGELVPVLCDQIVSVADTLREAEIASAKAQLKASLLMGLESTSNRCEQHAAHQLIFGRPVAPAELVEKVEAVDAAAVARVARTLTAARPTVAALGQVGGLESFERIAARLAA